MNILLIRTSAIGDVVMASGLIPAIKARYPHAFITWVVEPAAASLLSENEKIGRVIVWNKGLWKTLWKNRRLSELLTSVREFRRELRREKYDLVIDAQGLLKSSILAWLSGGEKRIGLGRKEGSWVFNTEIIEKDENDPRMCSEYRTLAQALELPAETFAMDLPYSPSTQQRAKAIVSAPTRNHQRYVVICPFTTRPQKHWVDEYWLSLAIKLRETLDVDIVMLGGPGDHDHANALEQQSANAIINLVGKTTLLEAVAIIDHADLLVGVDTGLTHMGIAKQTPTVGLFGSTRPYLETQQPCAYVVYEAMPCSPCRRNPTCDGDFTCMKRLTPERVLAEAKGVMT